MGDYSADEQAFSQPRCYHCNVAEIDGQTDETRFGTYMAEET